MEEIESEEVKLSNLSEYYHKLFLRMVLDRDYSHWFTWSLGWGWRARQIDINSWKETSLSPVDLGIIAISISIWSERNIKKRMDMQSYLVRSWIINNDDLTDHRELMLKRTKPEHQDTHQFRVNLNENAAKILILHRAYEALQWARESIGLPDAEERIILWYVIALLGGKYQLRPYMIDKSIRTESWVDVYDHLFDEFSPRASEFYSRRWYSYLFSVFHEIRNEIAKKKLSKRIKQIAAVDEFSRFYWRMQEAAQTMKRVDIILRWDFTQSPPLASSHLQDPQSP